MRSYECSHLIQFIIAVHSPMKSVELTGKRGIFNEAPWGLKYLLFTLHEICLSSEFYIPLFQPVRISSKASLTLNAIWTVLMYSKHTEKSHVLLILGLYEQIISQICTTNLIPLRAVPLLRIFSREFINLSELFLSQRM